MTIQNAAQPIDSYESTPHDDYDPGGIRPAEVGEGPVSAPVLAALEAAWAAIRARHPEVPAVVVVLASGSDGGAGGVAAAGPLRCDALAEPGRPRGADARGVRRRRRPRPRAGPGAGTLLHEATTPGNEDGDGESDHPQGLHRSHLFRVHIDVRVETVRSAFGVAHQQPCSLLVPSRPSPPAREVGV
jgi:hypothetical protein